MYMLKNFGVTDKTEVFEFIESHAFGLRSATPRVAIESVSIYIHI